MKQPHPLTQAVISGRRKEVPALLRGCLDGGEDAKSILENRLMPAMATVGELFKRNEIFVPEMLVAARAMKDAMQMIEAMLADANARPKFTALIGSVEGDLHDIGKNLVTTLWKGANIEVIDLGVNVSPSKFIEAVRCHKPHLVGLSALLTTTLPVMRTTVEFIRRERVRAKVMVGGAPVTQSFADEVGADGYARDAGSAVDVAMRLLNGGRN